jgi:hypothetical protein
LISICRYKLHDDFADNNESNGRAGLTPIVRIKFFDFLYSALEPICVIVFALGLTRHITALAMTGSVLLAVVMAIYFVGYVPLYRPSLSTASQICGIPIPRIAGTFAIGFMSVMFVGMVLVGAGISIGIAVWIAQPWYIGLGIFFSVWSAWVYMRHPIDRVRALTLSNDRAQRRLEEMKAADIEAMKSVAKS